MKRLIFILPLICSILLVSCSFPSEIETIQVDKVVIDNEQDASHHIEIITHTSATYLEQEVNQWITAHPEYTIIDILYSSSSNTYSVCIVYQY